MKLFKNFKTKKQLRAEIERLQWRPPVINVEQVEIQKLCASYLVDNHLLNMEGTDVSEKYAKKRIAEELARQIAPFIEYDVENCSYGKIYGWVLRVVGRNL